MYRRLHVAHPAPTGQRSWIDSGNIVKTVICPLNVAYVFGLYLLEIFHEIRNVHPHVARLALHAFDSQVTEK